MQSLTPSLFLINTSTVDYSLSRPLPKLATREIGPLPCYYNTCVVKPTPWVWLLSILQLSEIANDAGIPEGVLNIVSGGVEAGEAPILH